MFRFISLQHLFYCSSDFICNKIKQMLRQQKTTFILLQHLFYFIANVSASLLNYLFIHIFVILFYQDYQNE